MRHIIVPLALAAACERPAPPPAPTPPVGPNPAAVETAIRSSGEHYKAYILNSDALGIASLFTPDGHLESVGLPPLTGKRVIAEGLQGSFKSMRYTAWDLTISHMGALGTDSARAEGALHEVIETKGRTVHRWLQWRTLYLKEPDGYYRIHSLTAVLDSAR